MLEAPCPFSIPPNQVISSHTLTVLAVKAGMEIKTDSRRRLFNLIGGGIVVLWLLLIGLLIKKVNHVEKHEQAQLAVDRQAVVTSPQQAWMEIYLEDKKVGYSVNKISPLGENYLVREEIFLKLNLMGQTTDLYTVTSCVVDHDFVLKTFMFRMSSGVVTFKAKGSVWFSLANSLSDALLLDSSLSIKV